MSLEALPAEILHLICSFCTTDQNRCLRLTSRSLREVADEHFLETVYTCFEQRDLAAIRTMCRNAPVEVRKNVRSLFFQADSFPMESPNQEEWLELTEHFFLSSKKHIKTLLKDLSSSCSVNHRVLHAFGEYYQFCKTICRHEELALWRHHYVKKQEDFLIARDAILDEKYVDYTMSTLFEACPNIQSLSINHKHGLRRNIGLTNEAFLNGHNIAHGTEDAEASEAAIVETLHAACDAGIKLRHLSMGCTEPYWMSGTPHSRAKRLPKMYAAIKDLESLYMSFNGEESKEEDGRFINNGWSFVTDTFEENVMRNWLRNCPQLRSLHLHLPQAPFVDWMVDIDNIIGDLHLPSLNTLYLAYFQTKPEQLGQILLRHKDTLTSLELCNVHTETNKWPECFASFAGKLTNLQHVALRGQFTSVDEHNDTSVCTFDFRFEEKRERAERYIREGDGMFPLVPEHVFDTQLVELAESEDSQDEDNASSSEDDSTDSEDDEAAGYYDKGMGDLDDPEEISKSKHASKPQPRRISELISYEAIATSSMPADKLAEHRRKHQPERRQVNSSDEDTSEDEFKEFDYSSDEEPTVYD